MGPLPRMISVAVHLSQKDLDNKKKRSSDRSSTTQYSQCNSNLLKVAFRDCSELLVGDGTFAVPVSNKVSEGGYDPS